MVLISFFFILSSMIHKKKLMSAVTVLARPTDPRCAPLIPEEGATHRLEHANEITREIDSK